LKVFPLASASLGSYDPTYDNSGHISAAASDVILLLASTRQGSRLR
jgi:hypothetical protein